MSDKNSQPMTKDNLISISESLEISIKFLESNDSCDPQDEENLRNMIDSKQKIDSLLEKMRYNPKTGNSNDPQNNFINCGINYDNRSKSLPGYGFTGF